MKVVLDGGPVEVPAETPVQRVWRLAASGAAGGYAWRAPDGSMSWTEVVEAVRGVAGWLRGQGLQQGDRVAVMGGPSWHWKVVDLAVQAAGGVTAAVHPTLTREAIDVILEDCTPRFVIAGPEAPRDGTDWLHMEEVAGHRTDDEAIDRMVAGQDPEAPAVMIYTSGTTGRPKGVVLRRRHITAGTQAFVEHLQLQRVQDPSFVAFLPLAHVAGYMGLEVVTAVSARVTFSRPDRFIDDLQAVQPTLLGAVPRLFERIVRKVRDLAAESPVRKALVERAFRVAQDAGAAMQRGGRPTGLLALRHGFYERLVYRALRQRLGLARVQCGLAGGATARPGLLLLLQGLGVNVVEGYGMSETTAVGASNRVDDFQAGTVGVPYPGMAIALDDGEVLLSGPAVFDGYHAFDEEGLFVEHEGRRWLRTGDIGEIRDGRLAIVDRKKELLVLDTGKKLAPAPIEDRLVGIDPLVEDALLLGSERPVVGLLIQPDYDRLIARVKEAGGAEPTEREAGTDPTGAPKTYGVDAAWVERDDVRGHYASIIDRLNGTLSPHEHVRTWALVPHAFTIERGELTPSFKKRRKQILAAHSARVDALYG